jgi:hypothetical protein
VALASQFDFNFLQLVQQIQGFQFGLYLYDLVDKIFLVSLAPRGGYIQG